MKTLFHPRSASILSFLAATYLAAIQPACGQTTNTAANEIKIQGRPLAVWVAEVGQQTSERDAACETLVAEGPRLLPSLANILLHDPSTDQRWKAALAMGAIAYHHPGAAELPAAVPALATAARSEDREIRTYSIQGLGAIGQAASNTIPLLIHSVQDKESGVRMSAAEALGRIGIATPQVLAALKTSLSDRTGDVAIISLDSLVKLGHPPSDAIPVLRRLTKDDNSAVRCIALERLARMDPNSRETIAALNAALSDPKEHVRMAATNALNKAELK